MALTDFLIAIATTVFIMSTISERVANFLKLYFQDKIIYIPIIPYKDNGKWVRMLEARLSILAQKQITEAAEKEREYRIMVINIIVGILSAAFININIFELLAVKDVNGLQLHLGWTTSTLKSCEVIGGILYLLLFLWSSSIILFSKLRENAARKNQRYTYIPFYCWIITTLIFIIITLVEKSTNEGVGKILIHFGGYLTMGVFLSLGSKFWHDLLDILFSFKRTQEKLSDPKLLTDFSSADQIIKYTEISQYNIAEQLYEKYRPKLWGIEGVVSCGLVTYFDERVRLYQKRIEVEFTTNEAQDQLLKIQAEGEVQINYNTFLLKDYLLIKFTKKLMAVPAIGIDVNPMCYAINTKNKDLGIKGSFNVKKTGDKYVAFSCLHVFAADDDFRKFQQNEKALLSDDSLEVEFYINGVTLYGTIIPKSVLFGNQHAYYGADYCECEIDEVFYRTYLNFIQPYQLEKIPEKKIQLFGATSKLLQLKSTPNNRISCDVDYGGDFVKSLELYKIDPDESNVNPGDSGATVYYKESDSSRLCMGMIIAKSDNNAYMSKLWTLELPNICKSI